MYLIFKIRIVDSYKYLGYCIVDVVLIFILYLPLIGNENTLENKCCINFYYYCTYKMHTWEVVMELLIWTSLPIV